MAISVPVRRVNFVRPSAQPSVMTRDSASTKTAGNDVYIIVLGASGTGKSNFVNLASGSNLGVGQGLQSCTSAVQPSPFFDVDGRRVQLIDTPGFNDTAHSDLEILTTICVFLATLYQEGHKLHGVVYMQRISDNRVGGTSKRSFTTFREICGEHAIKNALLVTSMWEEVMSEAGDAREHELATKDVFFKPAIDGGAQMMRHDGTRASALNIVRNLLSRKPQALQVQIELVNRKLSITETTAGLALNRELSEVLNSQKKAIRTLEAEINEATRARDDETRRELEEERAVVLGQVIDLEAGIVSWRVEDAFGQQGPGQGLALGRRDRNSSLWRSRERRDSLRRHTPWLAVVLSILLFLAMLTLVVILASKDKNSRW